MSKRLTAFLMASVLAGCGGPERAREAAAPDTGPVAAPPAKAGVDASRPGPTLRAVRQRDGIVCGVNEGLVGFAYRDNRGRWRGFDVDFCRALAAAVLGDPDAARFLPLTTRDRLPALVSGKADVLWRNTSWTFSRDAGGGVDFAAVNYYDGQGFMVARSLDVSSATELNGARVCVQSGSTTEPNLADWFRSKGLNYQKVVVDSEEAGRDAYATERCDAFTADVSALAAARTTMANPNAHVILPEVISKEPMGPVVRQGDDQWTDVVRWTLYALILAEELGVTSQNVDEMRASSTNPEVRRLLGVEGELGPMLGLKSDWAYRAIKAVGNYGEVFQRNVGSGSSMRLERGLNAPWNGNPSGLLYAPPMR